MVQLKVVEESEHRLVFRIGAWAMLCHMSLCSLVAAVVSFSLTLFLRRYIGIFAIVFVGAPGLIMVICGFFGCANARQFTFAFDMQQGDFVARAGSTQLVRSLSEIQLVHIERECNVGGLFGNDAPSFAATLLFSDGHRCRLEAGVSVTGSGRGPDHVQEDQSTQGSTQVEGNISRWVACQGIAPRLETPLLQYEWVEVPEGPVRLPGAAYGSAYMDVEGLSAYPGVTTGGSAPLPGGPRWSSPPARRSGHGPVVMGRPQVVPLQRAMQIVVPEGVAGQVITVTAPDGAQVTVTVPADITPGEAMTIQY
mmetsp:Transcript_16018/g.55678  ORF Transcript_16018/g.55678 Transcript_16018/m.55678 type:complete len:309 (-) Transcript_16018:122-1048(-)